jgi:hypothetical protein
MKQKIIATTFLFILLCAGCIKTGDPIIGNWKMLNVREEVVGGNHEYIEFRPDGTYSQNFLMGGKWKRLDDTRLEMKNNPLGPFKEETRIVAVKIEGNVLAIAESDGKSAKFRR